MLCLSDSVHFSFLMSSHFQIFLCFIHISLLLDDSCSSLISAVCTSALHSLSHISSSLLDDFFGVSLHELCFSALSQWQKDMFLFNSSVASIHSVHFHYLGLFLLLLASALLQCTDAKHQRHHTGGKKLSLWYLSHPFLFLFSCEVECWKILTPLVNIANVVCRLLKFTV